MFNTSTGSDRSNGRLRQRLTTALKRLVDRRECLRAERKAHPACGFADLLWTFRTTQSGRDPRLRNRPGDDEFRQAAVQSIRDQTQVIDEILIPLPFFPLKHRILFPAIPFIKLMIPAEMAGQETFQQRPIDDD